MRKAIVIIFLGLIIVAGCSVKRKVLSSATDSDFTEMLNISDVTELNFTAQSFFIQRADLNIVGNGGSQKATATIKFAEPDSFLISVRALGVLEVARILITSDTILINDRLNSTLYFGSNQNVKNKYGFDLMVFPILLGDLITGSQTLTGINCNGGNAVLRELRGDYIINYFINCETKKCKKVTVENEFMDDSVSIEFDSFDKADKMIFPTYLRINNFANFALFEMEVKRIEFNIDSGIEFVPGRNYTRVEIK